MAQQVSNEDRQQLHDRIAAYFSAVVQKDFAVAVAILYPGDVDKFKAGMLWCAEALESFGESAGFLSVFGGNFRLTELAALDPADFLQRYLAGMNGNEASPNWQQVADSLQLRKVQLVQDDEAQVEYRFNATPGAGKNLVTRDMRFQKVGDQWFGLLKDGMTDLHARIRRQVGDFRRREAGDVIPPDADPEDWRAFAIWGYKDEDGNPIIQPRFADAGDFVDGRAPVKFFRKWGYLGPAGETVIEPQFDRAEEFSEGLAAVAIDEDLLDFRWGFVDRDGNLKIDCQFDEVRAFCEDRAAAKIGEMWGFIDRRGKWAIDPQFSSVADFDEGEAEVEIEVEGEMEGEVETEYRIIDLQGNRIDSGE